MYILSGLTALQKKGVNKKFYSEGKKSIGGKDIPCKTELKERIDDENGNYEEGNITQYVDQTMANLMRFADIQPNVG